MGKKVRRIPAVAMASAGALILASCASNADAPTTFAATVAVVGEADEVSADTGVCTVGETRLAPNDEVALYGERASAIAKSTLEVESVDQNADGTGVCRYVAHFDAVPANQKSYELLVTDDFVEQSFTSGELEKGATYVVRNSAP